MGCSQSKRALYPYTVPVIDLKFENNGAYCLKPITFKMFKCYKIKDIHFKYFSTRRDLKVLKVSNEDVFIYPIRTFNMEPGELM